MAPSRQPVAVLHARQYIEIDLSDVFPPDRFDVTVFTSADPASVWRPGLVSGATRVAVMAHPPSAALFRDQGGAPALVVTNDEYCLEVCAALRRELGLPARHPADLARYRDKVVMKRALMGAGIATPDLVVLDPVHRHDAVRVVDGVGLPCVVKPRQEANTRGVEVLPDRAALDRWLDAHDGSTGWHAERYIDGTHGHVNSFIRDGHVEHIMVGTYLGSLLGLGRGAPAGGMTVAGQHPVAVAGRALASRVASALGDQGAFVAHTEFVVDHDGCAWVIEAAARAPGAMVSDVSWLHAGVHQVRASYAMQADEVVPGPVPTGLHAGWMWFPAGHRAATTVRRPGLASPFRLQLGQIPPPHQRSGFVLGATLLAWNSDAEQLAADLHAVAQEPPF